MVHINCSKMKLLFSLVLLFIVYCLTGCRPKQECPPFNRYEYIHDKIDSADAKNIYVYLDTLIKRFEETPIKGLDYKAYHLFYMSAFGFGQSIKFEINQIGCFLTVKCIKTSYSSPDCKDFKTKITEDEWNVLEALIYEFDFWKAEPFRNNKSVLDGNGYVLEGNRPYPIFCDPITYKLVARGSPRFDKIEALCYEIMEYKEQLVFRYSQHPSNL